jgi:hypothetical protein
MVRVRARARARVRARARARARAWYRWDDAEQTGCLAHRSARVL